MRSRGRSNHGAAANRRHAGQSDGSDNLSATVAADRAFPATVAELGSLGPMLHRPTTRVLFLLFCSVAFCWLDYLIQTRLPHAGPYSAFEDSWWYRALNWTVPPEGERGLRFALYTAASIAGATIILYIVFTLRERRLSSKRRV